MSNSKKLSKEQLLKAIEKLEKDPGDRGSILAEAGITAFGAAGAGALAAFFGAGTASIPLVTALTGIGLTVAAPVALVAGAAVAGSAAAYGLTQWIKGSGYDRGKTTEIHRHLIAQLNDIEAREKQSSLSDDDKTKFYIFLKEPLQLDLISSEDAQQLMSEVESGKISLTEAYHLLEAILMEAGLESEVVEPFNNQEDLLTRVLENYENKKYDEAWRYCQELLEVDPNNANAHLLMGCISEDKEDYQSAVVSYTKVIELEPNHDVAYARRGHIYAAEEEYENAIFDYTRSLKIEPNDADLYCSRGRVHLALNNIYGALEDFTKAIDLDVNCSSAYFFRGYIHSEQENYHSAIIEYTKAIQLDSNEPGLYLNRARSYRDIDNYSSAIADCERVIQLDSQYVDAYFIRGCIYSDLENYSAAIVDFTQTIKIQPDCVTAYLYRGDARVELKNYQDALSDYNLALKIDPDYADAYASRGYLYSAEEDYQKAIEDFCKAMSLFEEQMRIEEAQLMQDEICQLKPRKLTIASQTDLLVERAKKGDPNAIASLVNKSLEARGIKVIKSIVKQKCLHFLLETEKVPNQEKIAHLFKSGLLKLNLDNIDKVKIHGCYKGDKTSKWSFEFFLNDGYLKSL